MFLFILIIAILLVMLTLYGHIESKLPKKFRFLHSSASQTKSSIVESTVSNYGPVLPQAAPGHWLVSVYGANSRAVRAFRSPIRAPGQTYDSPFLYFSCYQGMLYSWLDTRLRAASASNGSNAVAVAIDGSPPQLWQRGHGTILIVPDPIKLLRLAEKAPRLTLGLAFDGAPQQSLVLDLKNAQPLARAMASCAS